MQKLIMKIMNIFLKWKKPVSIVPHLKSRSLAVSNLSCGTLGFGASSTIPTDSPPKMKSVNNNICYATCLIKIFISKKVQTAVAVYLTRKYFGRTTTNMCTAVISNNKKHLGTSEIV